MIYFDDDTKHSDLVFDGLTLTDIKGVSDVTSDKQKAFLQYFYNKTQNKRAANRSDLVPEELVGFLPFTVLADILLNENNEVYDLYFRLIGTVIAGFYGERSAENLTDYVDENAVLRVLKGIRLVLENKRPIHYRTESNDEEGGQFPINIIMFPFEDEDKHISQVFCFFEFELNEN